MRSPELGGLHHRHAKTRGDPSAYEKFAYSNLGYALLGGIITAASGQPWAAYLQQHVLDPLGMSETRPLPSADDPLLATGYTREKEGYQRAAPAILADEWLRGIGQFRLVSE